MRAVVMREFGPPEVLQLAEVPDPEPGPGQVVIDVRFSSVTFVETQVRAGRPPNPRLRPELPAILGNGVGGVVSAVGQQVSEDLLGRRVVASLGGTGGYASRAVIAAGRVHEIPEPVKSREATALLADGRTAVGLTRRAAIKAGETILVEAAAGGVGTLLVQLAKSAGARVIALASEERKLAVALQLGADLAVSYAAPDWADAVRAATDRVDVAFDGVGGQLGITAFGLVAPGGRFVPFGMASGALATVPADVARRRRIAVLASTPPSAYEMREYTTAALAEAVAGRLRPVIGQVHALAGAAQAHAAIEGRQTIGKTLLGSP
ncbi:MAG TPA: zinc-binding dehydrogenase [Trebonia sp.]|nr:zinc-binding dehydrogenase [Trebonia sp.]